MSDLNPDGERASCAFRARKSTVAKALLFQFGSHAFRDFPLHKPQQLTVI
jgi:hypothetical protein